MEKTLQTIVKMYEKYTGTGMHMILLGLSLIYLFFFLKDKELKKTFWGYSLLFGVVCACPFTADIIIKFFIGRSVYWRMFWILPSVMITAFAFAHLLQWISRKWIKGIAFIALAVIIGVTGTNVYTSANFKEETNRFKLPLAVPTVCTLISEDAKNEEIETIKVLVPNDLVCYIRQYDASFYMPYGRNAFRAEDMSGNEMELYGQMNAEEPHYERMDELLKAEGCNYLVWSGNTDSDLVFKEMGYQFLIEVEQYRIYRIDEQKGA